MEQASLGKKNFGLKSKMEETTKNIYILLNELKSKVQSVQKPGISPDPEWETWNAEVQSLRANMEAQLVSRSGKFSSDIYSVGYLSKNEDIQASLHQLNTKIQANLR